MVPSANNHSLYNRSEIPPADRYYIAFSGGSDSTALLHALAQETCLKDKLTAIHVNHNINPHAKSWAQWCADLCYQLKIPLITKSVDLPNHSEASCRQARLNIFKEILKPQDVLITAHHLNDQIETVLFRFFRGTGLNGLTGIQKSSRHLNYQVFRPMLKTHKSTVKEYLSSHHIDFITDPSNTDNRYSRNFIRNKVLPVLLQYNDNVINHLQQTIENLQDTEVLIQQLIGQQNPIDLTGFKDPSSLQTALYHWINNLKVNSPNKRRLLQFSKDCLQASADRIPEIKFNQFIIKKWQHKWYLLIDLHSDYQGTLLLSCHSNDLIKLPQPHGSINFISPEPHQYHVQIKFNQESQKIRLPQKKHSQSIKKLLQQLQIPPWQRPIMPYVYINDKLMAVGDQIISVEFDHLLTADNAQFKWHPPQFLR